MHTRTNVWIGDQPWTDVLFWYAHGVRALQERALADPTSWRFAAAIHGFDARRWQALGYLGPDDPPPAPALRAQYWDQCQHGSWYFLPWHRGYVWAFETMVRAAVVAQGGPADWALPYWNYFGTGQQELPPAFAQATMPDDSGPNPLYMAARYGPDGDGHVYVPIRDVNLRALREPHFTGVPFGGSPGFGGVDTGFSHGGRVHGSLESQPHDMVHVYVGGARGDASGAMSVPSTAGLDPIFWLHHANIDRLWETWRRSDPGHTNPTEPTWLDGPAALGERPFTAPLPDGSPWTYTPRDVADLTALDYTYDSFAPAVAQGAEEPVVAASAALRRRDIVPEPDVELVGSNDARVVLGAGEVRTRVRLDPGMRHKVAGRRPVAPDGGPSEEVGADRVLLNLEGIRGDADATLVDVYVGPAPDTPGGDATERLAGSVALFGVSEASDPDGPGAGSGLTHVLDISPIVDQLHIAGALDLDDLTVRLVPRVSTADHEVTVDRVSVFREAR